MVSAATGAATHPTAICPSGLSRIPVRLTREIPRIAPTTACVAETGTSGQPGRWQAWRSRCRSGEPKRKRTERPPKDDDERGEGGEGRQARSRGGA